MATYAIGDVQGCFDSLQKLLASIQFNDQDTLWFCGDMINRGPDDLATLRFIKGLGLQAKCVLGNHDMHALAVYHGARKAKSGDTFVDVFDADDGPELMHWLQHQPLMHHDPALNFTMVHAGISPHWSLPTAAIQAKAFANQLHSDSRHADQTSQFLASLYGNEPAHIDQLQTETEHHRFTFNSFTRMRILKPSGAMEFRFKGSMADIPEEHHAWFEAARQAPFNSNIVFGHWSALGGYYNPPFFCIDTGCVWGGQLTALRLDDQSLFHINN